MNTQQSMMPTLKVTVGALSGAICMIAVWALGRGGIVVPPEIAVAISTVISFILAYVTPPHDRDGTLPEAPPPE